jgi:hypothetical protein
MKAFAAFCAALLLTAGLSFGQRAVEDPAGLTAAAGSEIRGANLVENFETFPTGSLTATGINGWTSTFSASHAIVDTTTISGIRSWRQTSDGSAFSDTASSPTVTQDFGIIASDVRINTVGLPNVHQWNPVASTNTFNTRISFDANGAIRALQVVAGVGAFAPTTGTWASGETFQIAVETTPAGVLRVYKNGGLIFTGQEINFALNGVAQGTNRWNGFQSNNTGSTGGTMTMDNFTNQLVNVPEPTTLAAMSLIGLVGFRRSRRA